MHGRNPEKLENAAKALSSLVDRANTESYLADLSRMDEVETLAKAVSKKHEKLDVLINNAGVYSARDPVTEDGLDVRFAVNTIAPYLLTQRLLPLFEQSGRIINLSSAAQAPIDLKALTGQVRLPDMEAYAQSKLALTMWSRCMGLSLKDNGPVIIDVNPGSMLGSKMVKQAFGVASADIRIGAQILTRATLEDEFQSATGKYFDNDSGQFASPYPDALDPEKFEEIVHFIETILAKIST